MKFKGIIPEMLTPLTEEQQVNEQVALQLTQRMVDAGVNGVFALETNEEFHLLDEKES
ncbi:dihydrodipicolinate synthase family protein [Paenibacillus jiagnxiensis]|uniref:dihydrodipicolinate synthase family protein n=1 Tax=Paenibacillus jiagnxiensis TaxID=3228926 RepID=UPI0033A87B06